MNNRLHDLSIDENILCAIEDKNDNDVNEMENGKAPLSNNDKKDDTKLMCQFFNDIDTIKEDIKTIKSSTKRIGEINEEAILATESETEAKLSRQLDSIIKHSNKSAKAAKNKLASIEKKTTELKSKNIFSPSDMRVRENLYNTLTRKFIHEMKEYQNAQQKYKADIKKKAKRQIRIIKPDATEDEVENIMNSEGDRDTLYREAILSSGVNDSIKTAYQTIADKYQDVRTLEQSLAELNKMFFDFALLTEEQGELLDQIEFNVKIAEDHIDGGNDNIKKALDDQIAIRKKQCIILLIAAVITLIVLFSLKIIP